MCVWMYIVWIHTVVHRKMFRGTWSCAILFVDGSLLHAKTKIVTRDGGVVWRCACGAWRFDCNKLFLYMEKLKSKW